jgi:3'(2'), 5'-bisphosphate nucleotidase
MIAGVRGSHLWRLAGGVAQTAVIAARRIMAIYETEFEVRHKHDKTPVTDADLAAHEIISRGLAALEPGVPILSEEGEIPPFERRSRWQDYWLVDPLDGTRGFAARSGEFTINVALVSNGRPVLGIVAVPVTGSCYAAVQDGGARLRHADGAWQRIRARRLPAGQVTVLRSRRRRHADVDRLLVKLGGVRVMVASSSLKACLVARVSRRAGRRWPDGPAAEAFALQHVGVSGESLLRRLRRPAGGLAASACGIKFLSGAPDSATGTRDL